jgi:hypothetical protein
MDRQRVGFLVLSADKRYLSGQSDLYAQREYGPTNLTLYNKQTALSL